MASTVAGVAAAVGTAVDIEAMVATARTVVAVAGEHRLCRFH